MKVLVLGSGGYVGQNLVARLRERAIEVSGLSSADPDGIDPRDGLLRPGFRIPEGTTTLIYLAQSPFHRSEMPRATHVMAVNVLSAVRAAEAARRARVERFIYTSSGNVYQPSFLPFSESAPVRRDNWYSLSKIQAEEALSLFRKDMLVTIARLFGVYGPNQTNRLIPNLVHAVLRGEPIRIERHPANAADEGGLRISLCYIEDLVEILLKIAEADRVDCVNVAGPEAISVRDISEAIGRCLDKEPVFDVVSVARQSDLVADTSYLQTLFSHSFVPFKEAIAQVVESIRTRGSAGNA